MADFAAAKTLREQELIPLAKEIRRMADIAQNDKREFTPEEQTNWEKVNKDFTAVRARIDVLERSDEIDAYLARPAGAAAPAAIPGRENMNGEQQRALEEANAPADHASKATDEQRHESLKAWLLSGTGRELSVAQRQAQAICLQERNCYVENSEFVVRLKPRYAEVRREARALSAFNQPAGGYTIPEGFMINLEVALLQYNGPRKVAGVFRTDSGNDLPWPTVNDTMNKGSLIAENTTVTSKDVVFGQIVFHAYKYTSGLVLVPEELLEDSAFNIGSELGTLLGIRLGRIQADDFTTGSGASKPTGIVTAATSGLTASSPTSLTADDIYTLKHSVDPAYRENGGWMFHDQILLAVKKLKDGQGRYIWQAGLESRAPETLDGDPITINQSMVNTIATGNRTMLYGDFSKFKIRDVAEIRLKKLVERYADADQVAFLAFLRCDSNLLDAGTHPVKYMVH